MTEFDRNETGSLFKNDRRKTDRHPHYRGDCLVDGVEYWISAWLKPRKGTNEKWVSLSFTRKEEQAAPPPASDDLDFDDEDIPF